MLVLFIAGLTMDLNAQGAYQTSPHLSNASTHADEAKQSQRNKASAPVTIIANDSTVEFVVREVTRQARLRAVYDNAGELAKKRVTIKAVRRNAMDALTDVLMGTGFIAKLTSDGETVVIRPAKGVPREKTQGELGTIRGRVTDTTRDRGIGGATVSILGTAFRTTTDEQGMFFFSKVPQGEWVIEIKAFGYLAVERKVTVRDSGEVNIRVSLSPTATTLSSVVTTATGQQRKAEIANDIAMINADSLIKTAPITSVTDLIAVARVPGVVVTPTSGQPGAPSRIRIGGIGSLMQNNDPVVIVDGVWINAATSTKDILRGGVARGDQPEGFGVRNLNGFIPSRLDDIDPNSIEKIEIIRGPSAATLYGTDAANGVIIITTKRGQAGKTRWNVQVGHDWDGIPEPHQSAYQGWGRSLFGEDRVIQCSISRVLEGICVQDSVTSANRWGSHLLSTDAAGRKTHGTMSFEGGEPTLQYFFSVTLRNELGANQLPRIDVIRSRRIGEPVPKWLLRPNTLDSRTFTSRLTAQPLQNLDLTLSLRVGQILSNTAGHIFYGFGGEPVEDSILVNLHTMRREREQGRVTTGIFSVSVDWKGWKWAIPHVDVGAERSNNSDRGYDQTNVCTDGGCDLPMFQQTVDQREQSVYTMKGRIGFPLSLKSMDHWLTLRPTIGADIRRNMSNHLKVSSDSLEVGSLDIGTAKRFIVSDLTNNSATAGWWTDVQIGLFSRFYTSVGFRRDVGSALSRRITPPTYPKLGTSWIVSEEKWFPRTIFLSSLKMRGAYGHSAVQPEKRALTGSYVVNQAIVNGQQVAGILLSGIGNPSLKPERSIELEYGMDIGLFDERTLVTATIVNKQSRDVLVPKLLGHSINGEGTPLSMNVAKVINRAVLLSVDSRLIERHGMLWTGRVSFSSQLNRVAQIGENSLLGKEDGVVEGYPLNGIWTRPVLAYNDVNGNGLLAPGEVILGDSSTYVGSGTPRYMFTYSTSLSLLRGLVMLTADFAYDGDRAQIQNIYDGWGAQDPRAPLAEQAYARIANLVGNRQSFSVLRFNTASAQFLLPTTVTRALRAKAGSVVWNASNLGLWTKYRGRDPSINSPSTAIGEGVMDDGKTMPPPRTYALLVRLTF